MNKHAPNRQPPITDDDLREAVRKAGTGGPFIFAEKIHAWMRSWGTQNELPPPEPDVFKPKR